MMKERKIAVICLGGFLFFMAVCTLIAKGIYTSGLPRVRLGSPSGMSISRKIEATGRVIQGQEYGIYTESGLRVETIQVKTGSAFGEGAPLFQIDVEDLKKLIAQQELALAELTDRQRESDLSSQQLQRSNKLQQQADALALTRAREDYEKAVRDGDLNISRMRRLLTEAQQALEQYRQTIQGAVVSPGDAGSAAAQQEKLKSLEQAVNAANQAVEDAILGKEDALRSAERNIEDASLAVKISAGSASSVNASSDAVELELAYRNSQLEALKALEEKNGWVLAETAGVVTSVRLQTGQRTTDTACILYTPDTGERLLEAVFDGEEEDYVALGAKVSLKGTNPSGSLWEKEAVIDYLGTAADGNLLARINLQDTEVKIGQTVKVQLMHQSENYSCCIPVGYLHSLGSESYFVYVAQEQEGILGTEWYVRMVPVTVLEKNSSYAAIESAGITGDSKIVSYYSKEPEDGSTVRVIE